jgi:hypothetical protein
MPRNSYQKLLFGVDDFFVVDQADTRIMDMDLGEFENMQIMVEVSYAATATPTGTTLKLFYGFGTPDILAEDGIPHVLDGTSEGIFGDTFDTVAMETITPGVGTPQTKRTVFFLTDPLQALPRWLRFQFENTDAVNPATIRIYGDP